MEARVQGAGHARVSATHASTFEVTTDDYLTPAGDCIIAIEADRAPADFSAEFVGRCQDAAAEIEAVITVNGSVATVRGRGHPDLTFLSSRSLVCRRSRYVDDRTVMVGADAAAADLPRAMVSALADGAALDLRLRVVS